MWSSTTPPKESTASARSTNFLDDFFSESSTGPKKQESELNSKVEVETVDIDRQVRELAQHKQELEARGRAIQSEKFEKEKIYANLSSENERISREIARLNMENLDKESNIESLKQEIADQTRAKEESTLQVEKLRKKSRKLFLCC